MVVTMKADTQPQEISLNPSWLPRKMPRWLTIAKATRMIGLSDYKNVSTRTVRYGITRRTHPYDRRKVQILMPELLNMYDFDTSEITFTDGLSTDKRSPNRTKKG